MMDQVRNFDYHHQRGWKKGTEEREEDGRTELESDPISRSSLIFGSYYGGSSSDYTSKYSSSPCMMMCREGGRSESGFREDWVPKSE